MKFTVLWLIVSSLPGDGSFPVHIQRIKGNMIVARPYTAPQLILKLKSGHIEESTVNCTQTTVDKGFAEHEDREVQFLCGNAVLELKAVYFGE
jgi:hypothetical protein